MKTVLITGAGSGIGAATAIKFAQNNYHVVLMGRRKVALEEVAKLCPAHSILPCDLQNPQEVKKAAASLLSRKDLSLEVLVNNAGIFTRHSFAEGHDETWFDQFNVNLFGVVRLTRELWPTFVKQNKGSIVMVSSTLGLKTSPMTSAYSASKAALISLTHSLALEGGPHRIRVNCVAPGIVDTPIHDFHSAPLDKKAQVLQNLQGLQPLGRIGTSQEIADSIYFLGSDSSSWTTGAVLAVDGGINLA